jgi:hypothetical protein
VLNSAPCISSADRVLLGTSASLGEIRGLGFFFYTRKGSFLYKISLYIITYHVAIIVYHCVSLSISQYIMSLGDT